MDDVRVNTKRLSFKGDPVAHKRKKKRTNQQESQNESVADWNPVLTLIDLIGPLFLLFPSDPPKCLSTTEELFSVNLARVSTSLTEAEPEHVLSVWTCRPVPGAQTYSLRASTGRYLSSDRLGVVTAEKEAIGPLEEWTPLLRQDGVVWQNAYGKFLTVDEETWTLRADADTIGFQQVWRIKCQEALRRERVKAEKATKAHTEKLQEAELIKKYQSYMGGKVNMAMGDATELHKAQREGRLAEAMLDRRQKLKSDKFCK